MFKKEHDITKLSSVQCLRHFIVSWSRVCGPLSLESFKNSCKGLGYFSTLLEEFKAGYRVKVGEIWKRGKKPTLKMSIYH